MTLGNKWFRFGGIMVVALMALMAAFGQTAATTGQVKTAAADSYKATLTIDGIPGDENNRSNSKEITLLSYTQDIQNQAGSFGGGAGGKAIISNVRVRKPVSAASVPLLLAAASGKHFKQATIHFTKDGKPNDFYTVKLEDV